MNFTWIQIQKELQKQALIMKKLLDKKLIFPMANSPLFEETDFVF